MNGVLAAWLLEIGVISIRDLAKPPRRLPFPSELLSTFIVFGGLSAIAGNAQARRPATAVAWGIVVATLLSAKVDFLKPVGDFFAPTGTQVPVQTQAGAGTPGGPASVGAAPLSLVNPLTA